MDYKQHLEKLDFEKKEWEAYDFYLYKVAGEVKRKLKELKTLEVHDCSSLNEEQVKFLDEQPDLKKYTDDVNKLIGNVQYLEVKMKDLLAKKMENFQCLSQE